MNCPVCGKELEKGNVMSGGGAGVFSCRRENLCFKVWFWMLRASKNDMGSSWMDPI